jgi:TRAP-type C4-dicarboxylate transport system permease small subunit
MSEPDDTAPPPRPPASPLGDAIFVRIPQAIIGALLCLAIAINFANVIARYFFFEALYWAEEVLIFMILWGVILAAATITYQGLHIRMDLFSAMMPPRIRRVIGGLTAVLMVCACVYVLVQSWQVVGMFWQSGEVSISAHIPLIIPHIAVPVGFALMALAAVVRLRSYVTDRFE